MSNLLAIAKAEGTTAELLASSSSYLLQSIDRILNMTQDTNVIDEDAVLDLDKVYQRLQDWRIETELDSNPQILQQLSEDDLSAVWAFFQNCMKCVQVLEHSFVTQPSIDHAPDSDRGK